MRNTFLFLAMLLAVQLVAQMAPSPNRQPPPRPLTLLEKDSVALDSIRFRLGITAQFSKLIDPSSNTNIGNYAAVDIKDAAVTFGGSVQGSKGNIWAVKFSGAITDGVAAIWQNRELNKDVSAGLQWHLLGCKKQRLLSFVDSSREAYAALRKLQGLRQACLRDTLLREKDVALTVEIAKRKAAIVAGVADSTKLWDTGLAKYGVDPLKWKHEAYAATDTNALKYAKLLAKLAFARDTVAIREAELARLRPVNLDRKWECRATFDDALHKLATPVGATGVSLNWVSVGFTYTSSKFKLYNDAVPYADQVTKRTQGAVEARVQWSIYHRDLYAYDCNYFFSVGLSGGIADNHEDLAELTLDERTTQMSPDTTVRTEITNYKVLKGEYFKDLATASLFMDAYYFVGERNSSAFHLFANHRVKERVTPSTSLGIGFMVGFVQKDKTTNAVNAEIYFNFPDLANNEAVDGNAWDRSDFGLRFSFPITFPQKS